MINNNNKLLYMCGIVGIIFKEHNTENFNILIDSLRELQNRGYDSMGISILDENKFFIEKRTGENSLESFQETSFHKIKNCVGHSRWATHGGVTIENAHPHLDSILGEFTMVHNGIIDNHMKIKAILDENKVVLTGQTDTEILLNYIVLKYIELKLIEEKSKNVKIDDENLIKHAILEALKNIEGTYGIVIQSKNHNDKLFCIRKGSPLIVGSNGSIIVISSEKQALPKEINKCIRLAPNELYICKFDNEKLINELTETVQKKEELSLGNFIHYTHKEIFDQCELVKKVSNQFLRINSFNVKLDGLDSIKDELKIIKNIYLFGCGTSYHSCLILQYFCLIYLNFDSINVYDASDFDPIYLSKSNVNNCGIFLSQSGETRDILVTHEHFLKSDESNITLGITNVADSYLSNITNAGLFTNIGKEKGVASTKSFTAQIISGLLIILWFHNIHKENDAETRKYVIQHLFDLDNDLATFIPTAFDFIKNNILPFIGIVEKMFIMGRNIDYFIAKEGALKIKEIVYISAEAYSSGALKHGPFALLDKDYFVIFILTINNQDNIKKVYNNITEILARNTKVLLITSEDNFMLTHPLLMIYKIPKTFFSFIFASIALQMIAYHMSVLRNINPDFPRNLAKVVTVE